MKERKDAPAPLLYYLHYRGYAGSMEYSQEDGLYVGKILKVADALYFHGKTEEEAEANFHDCVDEYIDWLQRRPR